MRPFFSSEILPEDQAPVFQLFMGLTWSMTPVEALQPAIALLGAGTVAALTSRAVKLSPMVGYIIAGVIIGPHGFNALADGDTTHLLAELGVVFLLFDIGLHFSLGEIRNSKKDMLILAPAQVIVCGLAFTLGAKAFVGSWPIAIAIGLSLALSSTAVVTRLLAERHLNASPLGRSSMALLVFQDIVAIFLLIFANSLAGDPSQLAMTMLTAAGQSLVAFAAAALLGRYVVRPLFRVLASAKVEEIFTMTAILIVLASAVTTGAIGLSLTLGAFLAGMAIADTPFRHTVQLEVMPFRGLLLSFFFVNVGLIIDLPSLFGNLPLVILIAGGLVLAKTVIIFIVARLSQWTAPGATQLAFLLSQGSEFTLVVLSIAAIRESTPGNWISILVAATALSLAVAPLWSALGMRLSRWLARRLAESGKQSTTEADSPVFAQHPRAIVFGMTDSGRMVLDALTAHKIPYVALDNQPDRFISALSDGYSVTFGDSSDFRMLESLSATGAETLFLGEPRYELSKKLTTEISERFPRMTRMVAVKTPAERLNHSSLGMKAHVVHTPMDSIWLAASVLRSLDVPEEKVEQWIHSMSERLERDDNTSDPEEAEDVKA